eukprot:760634-Amorphochlora_amoeboformis.AAC.1
MKIYVSVAAPESTVDEEHVVLVDLVNLERAHNRRRAFGNLFVCHCLEKSVDEVAAISLVVVVAEGRVRADDSLVRQLESPLVFAAGSMHLLSVGREALGRVWRGPKLICQRRRRQRSLFYDTRASRGGERLPEVRLVIVAGIGYVDHNSLRAHANLARPLQAFSCGLWWPMLARARVPTIIPKAFPPGRRRRRSAMDSGGLEADSLCETLEKSKALLQTSHNLDQHVRTVDVCVSQVSVLPRACDWTTINRIDASNQLPKACSQAVEGILGVLHADLKSSLLLDRGFQ